MAVVEFDASQFLGGLKEARAKALAAAQQAVNVFGEKLIGNAQEYTPVEKGSLQASGTTQPAETNGDKVTKVVGFNTHYAAARHERPPEHDAGMRQNPKGQWKYLERAMRELSPKFTPFVGDKVNAALK